MFLLPGADYGLHVTLNTNKFEHVKHSSGGAGVEVSIRGL